MKKDYVIVNKPEWVRKLQRNAKSRERYFKKRYGSLERMYAIDRKFQVIMDEQSFDEEMEMCK